MALKISRDENSPIPEAIEARVSAKIQGNRIRMRRTESEKCKCSLRAKVSSVALQSNGITHQEQREDEILVAHLSGKKISGRDKGQA